jgi:hypothetical protein
MPAIFSQARIFLEGRELPGCALPIFSGLGMFPPCSNGE